MFLAFKNGVKSIQTAGYNGTRTKFCKQQKIGGFEYFGDSDVVNKLKVMVGQQSKYSYRALVNFGTIYYCQHP